MLDFEQHLTKSIRIPKLKVRRDNELGQFGEILGAAIPMLTSVVGSMMSGGKKHPAADSAAAALNLAQQAAAHASAEAGGGGGDIKGVLKSLLRTTPPPVVAQVKRALLEMKNATAAQLHADTQVVTKIDDKFGPQVHAILGVLKAQQMQTQATYEHQRLQKDAAYRDNVTNTLASLSNRLNAIHARLNGSAIVPTSRANILGGRALLET